MKKLGYGLLILAVVALTITPYNPIDYIKVIGFSLVTGACGICLL